MANPRRHVIVHRGFFLALTVIWGAAGSFAQTVEILPSELSRIPVQDVGGGTYWQQLAIGLDHDDAAGDSTVIVELPAGVVVFDSDGDGVVFDEVRVVYLASGSEQPGFFLAPSSTPVLLVVGSSQSAAAGGTLFLQFPISNVAVIPAETVEYGEIRFADPREIDFASGPVLRLVQKAEFAVRASMGVVALTGVLNAGQDTSTTEQGANFPEVAQVLVLPLPDLVFDPGVGSTSNLLGFGDGDDSNDTEYRFFFSTQPSPAWIG